MEGEAQGPRALRASLHYPRVLPGGLGNLSLAGKQTDFSRDPITAPFLGVVLDPRRDLRQLPFFLPVSPEVKLGGNSPLVLRPPR